MTFTIKPLVSGGYLVTGTDGEGNGGRQVLHSERWDAVQAVVAHKKAMTKYDKATRKFFKPLTKAADEAGKAMAQPGEDWATVVVSKAKNGKPGEKIVLDEAGILLRLLHEGKHKMLIWADDRTLVAVQ